MYISEENADRAIGMLNNEMSRILSMGELSKETLCALGEIVDIMKDIKEIDKEDDMGNSYAGGSSYNRGYSNRMSYNNGGYSSRRGRSMDSERDRIMSKMDHFMNQASNENERELVRRIMDSI